MEYCSVMQVMDRVSQLLFSVTGTSGYSSSVGTRRSHAQE